jgi:hypothetical protein
MTRLDRYLRSLSQKVTAVPLPVEELEDMGETGSSHPVVLSQRLRAPATHLWRLYRVLKAEECGVPSWAFLHETKGAKTCFATLVQWIEAYRQDHLIVDPVDWIRAHLRVYGDVTYPPHLISAFSFDLYRRYLEVKHSTVTEPVTSADLEKGLRRAWRRARHTRLAGGFGVRSHVSGPHKPVGFGRGR